MYSAANLGKKLNRFRKKNWSAPTIMGAFIITCMIIIYSYESLGLSNKEKNLDYRISSPEQMIKVISHDISKAKELSVCNESISKECPVNLNEFGDKGSYDNQNIKNFTLKNREEHLLEIKTILIQAAQYQQIYENKNNMVEINREKENFLFCDV